MLTAKDSSTGQKSITLKLTTVLNPTMIPIMGLVRFPFFKNELHGTPHECSKCHSTTDFNLCTVSIAMCNKIFNHMTPFNEDRIRPRVTARAGGKMFSWLFDTGASVTCITAESLRAAFPHSKPRRVQNAQDCRCFLQSDELSRNL